MSTVSLESAAIHAHLATTCGNDVLLDHATAEEDGSWRGYKFVSAGEPCFQGHFPGHPILPGVAKVEAMVQLAQVATLELSGRRIYLKSVSRVKFRKPVHPGDLLVVSIVFGEDGMSATASTAVDGAVSCQARLVFCDELPEPVCGPTAPFVPDFEAEQLDVEQIMAIIPHRYPFLLVDRLFREKTGEEGEYGQVVGMKNVTASESFFTAGRPVVAATLLL
jgi:3-hydroxyacyl-[acyl-carrier-protein] dehydratase